jgi:hypothetical protein
MFFNLGKFGISIKHSKVRSTIYAKSAIKSEQNSQARTGSHRVGCPAIAFAGFWGVCACLGMDTKPDSILVSIFNM